METNLRIKAFLDSIGVDAYGFCKAKPMSELLERLTDRVNKGYQSSFENRRDISYTVDPSLTMDGAKSFIVILMKYPLFNVPISKAELKGRISVASIGVDYHTVIGEKLEKLKEFLISNFNCKVMTFCDTSPFSDRWIAYKAGLGMIGRNSFLINKKLGTATNIGYVLTDLELDEYDIPDRSDPCKDCNRCQVACPNCAITNDRQINASKCISYLTQSKQLGEEDKFNMGIQLYGCDICQLACPYNQLSEPEKGIVAPDYPIEDLLAISDKEFKETFGITASGWRGRITLQRNSIIALSNIATDEAVQLLLRYYDIVNNKLKEEIVRSLKVIPLESAKEALKQIE